MFSALSLAMHMGSGSQDDILASQPNQLGNPKPGLGGEQKHCPIAAPNPTGGIRGSQQSVDLFAVEEFDGPALMTFTGHREYSLAEQRMGGLLEGNILEEGVNRGQADVPGTSAILPASFKIIEKMSDERHVQIIEREVGWRFTQPLFCKLKQQAEGIAISRYGVGTRSTLPKKSIRKERLQKRGKASRHYGRALLRFFITRSVAN
jgi:hypothetical protein